MAYAKNVEGKPASTIENAQDYVPDAGTVTVFSAPWCGFCTQLKHQLTREGIAYTEIDIDADAAAERVAAGVNGGDWVIPTVLFSDGSSLVNAGVRRVQEMVAKLG